MQAHDIVEVMKTAPQLSSEDGQAIFWMPDTFNAGHLWEGRFRGTGPWTRHPDGDTLEHAVAGDPPPEVRGVQ